MKYTKKITAFLLSAAMTFTPVMTPVYAVDNEEPAVADVAEQEWVAMSLRSLPDKLYYHIGEELDLNGGTASASGHVPMGMNWDVFDQPINSQYFDLNTSEFDNTKPGTYNIYVSKRGAEDETVVRGTSFEVTVLADGEETPVQTEKNPDEYLWLNIMTLPRTHYQVGEKLDLTGSTAEMCHDVGEDSNSVIKPLTEFHVNTSEFDSTKPGIYNIYVTAKDGSLTATEVFTVTVEDKSEAEAIIDEPTTVPPTTDPTEFSQFEGFSFHAPTKKFYKLGDDLDLAGAYAAMVNGTQIPLTDPRFTVDASAYDNTKPGVYTIYVTFTDGGFERTEDFFAMVLNADGTAPDGYPTPTGEDNPYNPTSGIAMTTVPTTDGVTFDRLGDVDANGATDVMDVIKINKCLLGVSELTGLARLAADMNRNGRIDSEDAIAALKKSLGMVWQDAVEPTTEFYDPTGNCKIEPPTEDPTESTTFCIDPTDHCKEWASEEYKEPTTMLPSGAPTTQPKQITEHFYGADVSKGPASDGVNPPLIIVDTRPSGSLMGIYGYEFYKTNNLITIELTETSGSYKLTVDDVIVDEDGNYVVKITRSMPQIATCDLARWYLRVKTDKGCTDYAKVKLDITEKHI